MIYELKQYDKTLLKFEYIEESLSRDCHILEINNDYAFLLPIGLELTDDGLFSWLKSRIPSLWTNSYFVSTVGGAPLAAIKQYIENQKYV